MSLSPHVLEGTARVLTEVYGFDGSECQDYVRFHKDIAKRTGGGLEPTETVACRDREDNRVLELASAAGAFLIISSDDHPQQLSPWRGIPIIGPDVFASRVDATRHQRDQQGNEQSLLGVSSWVGEAALAQVSGNDTGDQL